MKRCKRLSGKFTLPDNCAVLAEATSTYGIVRDRTTFTLIRFVGVGTRIMITSWKRIESIFLLNIRAVKKSMT